MQTIRITTSQNIDIEYEIAGLGERMLATLIDYALFAFIAILFVILNAATNGTAHDAIIAAYVIVFLVLYVFYDLACEIFMNGQSIGKRWMKIKVISADGRQAGIGQYILRWIFRIVDFSLTGGACAIITAAVTEKSQRLGDIVAGTTLIRTVARTQMDALAFVLPAADNYQPVFTQVTQLNDKDIVLLHEVINSYVRSGNAVLVHNTAFKLKQLLNITTPIDDMVLLQTVIKDYSHIAAIETSFMIKSPKF